MKSEAADRAAHQGLAGRLTLFDLDGTLVDSTPGSWTSVRVAAAELGRPASVPAGAPHHPPISPLQTAAGSGCSTARVRCSARRTRSSPATATRASTTTAAP